jgi:hypothetical protein
VAQDAGAARAEKQVEAVRDLQARIRSRLSKYQRLMCPAVCCRLSLQQWLNPGVLPRPRSSRRRLPADARDGALSDMAPSSDCIREVMEHRDKLKQLQVHESLKHAHVNTNIPLYVNTNIPLDVNTNIPLDVKRRSRCISRLARGRRATRVPVNRGKNDKQRHVSGEKSSGENGMSQQSRAQTVMSRQSSGETGTSRQGIEKAGAGHASPPSLCLPPPLSLSLPPSLLWTAYPTFRV